MHATTTIRDDSPRAVWERAMHCMKTFDVEGYAECFAVDAVQAFPFAPSFMPTKLVGRARIREKLSRHREAALAEGRRLIALLTTGVHELVDPETVIVEFEMHTLENGVAKVVAYVHVVQVRNGEIVSLRNYFDSLAFAERVSS